MESEFEDYFSLVLNETEFEEQIFVEKPFVKISLNILVIIFYVAGIIGNSMMILIVSKKKSVQTSFNVFFAMLAVVEIHFSINEIAFGLFHPSLHVFILNHTMCKIITFNAFFGEFLSRLILAAALVTFAFYKEVPMKTCWMILFAVSIVAFYFAAPHGYFAEALHIGDDHFCTERWEDHGYKKVHKSLKIMIEAIALLAFLIIAIVKYKGFNTSPGTRTVSQKLHILAFISFVVWVPLFLTKVFEFQLFELNFILTIMMFVYIVNALNFVFKPLLFFLWDENFQNELISMMPCCVKRPTNTLNVVYQNENV